MRVLVSFLLSLSILLLQVSAIPWSHLEQLSHSIRERDVNTSLLLPTPSKDPWFQPPIDWELKAPGTVLKVRKSPYKQIQIPNCIDTFQVQYRTSDSHNNASWAVATQYIPASHANCSASNPEKCAHGIVSYEVPYDSADPDSTPSYLLQWGEPYGEMHDLLARGWFVSVPDYEGPLASYCAGVQAGHATLDSIKAVLQVAGQFGLRTEDAKVVLWGYSGGAMATEFAAELAGSYAPDLKLAGIVEGGTVPNITSVGKLMNKKDTAGLLVGGLVGITSQHEAARQYLISRLKKEGEYNATGFLSVANMTAVQALLNYEYQDVYAYFIGGEDDMANQVLLDMYNSDAVMGHHGIPNMPMFVYKAANDEMSAVNETDAMIANFCQHGANILYHRNLLGGHNQELWGGRPRALDFMSVVIDGKNKTDSGMETEIALMGKGCRVQNVTVAVNVTAINGSLEVLPLNVTIEPNGTVVLTPVKLSEKVAATERVGSKLDTLGALKGLFY